LDLTDLYVIGASDHLDKSVLIIDVNPLMTGTEFHPDAVYRINIDHDGDVHADVAYSFVFSEPRDGRQTAPHIAPRAGRPGSMSLLVMCLSRPHLSASMPLRSPSGPARAACSSVCAAIRSLPLWQARCTDSSGPGRIPLLARTCSPL